MAQIDPQDIETCLGHDEDMDSVGGSVMPPIVQTSFFAKRSFEELLSGLAREHLAHVYSRGQNPTVEALEAKLAFLERGEACKCFGSGMAAISAALLGLLEQGDHIVFANNIYGPTRQLASTLKRFGITSSFVVLTDTAEVIAAITPQTKLLYLETPGTMLFRLLDVPALTAEAKSRGVHTILDNSWATPLFHKPIPLGVDVVVHSATKYIGGHSDVVAGALITNDELMERIYYRGYMLLGGVLSPHDAWLLVRGLRTMPSRMVGHEANALALAKVLQKHPKVSQVFHPLLSTDDPIVFGDYFSGSAGVFSFSIKDGTFPMVRDFLNSLTKFKLGVSWGAVESQAISPNSGHNASSLARQNIPQGLVRLSVGLEDVNRLIDDVTSALSKIPPS